MVEVSDILTRSKRVRDETQVGGNTASRVGGILVDLCQLVKTGGVEVPSRDIRFRGEWSEKVANSSNPYVCDETTIDSVYYLGCKFYCKKDITKLPPTYPFTDWGFLEGNPYFYLQMTSSKYWNFRMSQLLKTDKDGNFLPFTTLEVTGLLYNQDVTGFMYNVVWTRDSGNPTADNKWALSHANCGLSVDLTYEDLGGAAFKIGSVTFRCNAEIKDGETMYSKDVSVNF